MLHLRSLKKLYNRNDYRAADAELRDERDMHRLAVCSNMVGRMLDELIPVMGRLEHPDASWSPDDLSALLEIQAAQIKAQQYRISRMPLVLDRRDDDL
jgi:hypothetical protein